MLIVDKVLTAEEIGRIRAALSDAAFEDGKVSASGAAREVKKNAEVKAGDARLAGLQALVKQKLAANSRVDGYARPVRWAPIILSRYGEGDGYGEHADAPFMGAEGGGEMRADLSFTLFLDDPGSYDGGELVLDSQRRPQPLKLAAGSAVIYPTSVLHAVAPVTRGVRRAAVGWIESRIRDPEQRLMLHEMELGVAAMPHGEARRRLTMVFANLLKMWS